MPSPHPQPPDLIARSLAEAIEAVATRPVREWVIGRALRDAGRASVPEAGPEVLDFAEGPLLRALSDRVGADVASEVLDQIRPVLQRASLRPSLRPAATGAVPLAALALGSVRPTRPAPADPQLLRAGAVDDEPPEEESGVFTARPRPARTDPAPSADMPIVFLASRDPGAAATLAQALGGRATVRVVEGLLDLLEAVDEEARARRVLVLDAAQPSIHVRSLVTVAPELAGRAKVVVWRAFAEDRETIANAPISAADWERCTSHAVAVLAETCVRAIR